MAGYSLEEVNNMYLDVLKELGNIGAGNATTAISEMLGMRLNMEVPQVKLLTLQQLGSAISEEDEIIAGIYLDLYDDLVGNMMFLLNMDSAHYLVNRLMGRDESYKEPFDEMDLSALREIGNIITGSYLSALSKLTQLSISPSVPFLSIDMAAAILSVPAIQFGQYGDNALLIETEFGDDVKLNGFFILLPEPDSYEKILNALGIKM